MANQEAAKTLETADGLVLVGSYLEGRDGKEWTGTDGVTRQPFIVSVLAGRSVQRVEYRTPSDAQAALGGVQRGDRVALRVFGRAHKGFLFLMGLSAIAETEAA